MNVYDAALFNPPAPVAVVTFINPANGLTVADVKMLIDTGSDATLVPASVCLALQVEESDSPFAVELVDGQRHELRAVRLKMKWSKYAINGESLIAQTEFGIIGRDILNRMRIRFDGPAQTWSFD
ncbi:MAG: hypothetical protein ACFLMY_08175 [Candidatus Brachytrichaceae bacterium NZ_4S206]|jgi:predicted aspartyl protease